MVRKKSRASLRSLVLFGLVPRYPSLGILREPLTRSDADYVKRTRSTKRLGTIVLLWAGPQPSLTG